MTAPSPFIAQYLRIKARCPDALLFFRMGDFYELFFDDAKCAANALDITLTARGTKDDKPIPMAGVPYHAAQTYIARLIRDGHRVALCDQLENPATAQALRGSRAVVKRDIVRIITPGTLTEENLLDARATNIVLAIGARKTGEEPRLGLALADVSTGQSEILPCPTEALAEQISARAPNEIVVAHALIDDDGPVGNFLRTTAIPLAPVADVAASPAAGERRLKETFNVGALDGFGPFTSAELSAAGLLFDYLSTTQAGTPLCLDPPARPGPTDFMAIDPVTRAGLEMERSASGDRKKSLLGSIDRTVTAMGSRLLAARITRPLTCPEAINHRLDAVSFLRDDALRARIRTEIKKTPDLARARARLRLNRGDPRDLWAIKNALHTGELICAMLSELPALPAELAAIRDALNLTTRPALSDLVATLGRALLPDPPVRVQDGDVIAPGFDQALDEARTMKNDSRRVIATLQTGYCTETGIQNLRIKHNNILGYFIEVSPKNAPILLAPPHDASFIHRQSLAGSTRFTTIRLRETDAGLSRAEDDVRARQTLVLNDLIARIAEQSEALAVAADGLARIDVAAALAEWAVETNGCRPVIDLSLVFEVEGGAHPTVLQAMTPQGANFTVNDCTLDASEEEDAPRLLLVTGPNMAGKSTYLRQNALLAILAQAGSFVPARRMRLGVIDRIFSRVGSGDELASGRSTFMVEMIETAAILNLSGPRTFIILDEVGRGTATYDGMAIAWACMEHLHDSNRCRALFATHYHELTALADSLPHAANVSLKAREWKGDLVFLYEIKAGPADKSYGVHVARLAGLPATVITRASEILARLEQGGNKTSQLSDLPLFAAPDKQAAAPSAPMTPVNAGIDAVITNITHTEPDSLSAREALDLVYRLKSLLRDGPG